MISFLVCEYLGSLCGRLEPLGTFWTTVSAVSLRRAQCQDASEVLSRCRDMVVLAAGDISEYATLTLKADGWYVHQVDAVDNPGMRGDGKFPERFYAVYSKLHVFGLQKYEKGKCHVA